MILPTNTQRSPFSAEVELHVEVNGERIPVSTVEPTQFVLEKPQLISNTEATLCVSINGKVQTTPIKLETPTEATREYQYQQKQLVH